MLVLVITTNYDMSFINSLQTALPYIDAIEIRLDYWRVLNLAKIRVLLKELPVPVIFTIRNKEQGGYYQGSERKRLKQIIELASLNPQYFDLEYNLSEDFINFFCTNYPDIKLIGSYHNFAETPEDLDKILNLLQSKKFDVYKIVTYANSTLDTLRMLTFVKEKSKKSNLVGICMGELGMPTRILGKIVGNTMNYTILHDSYSSAPGQVTLEKLLGQYNYKNLNSETDVYALLGDPVAHSIGDVFHNNAFQILKKNAVYVKLRVAKHELASSLEYMRQLPFKGFSITMPLKELAYNLVDSIDSEASKIQAINSIIVKDKYHGFNTDGKGAIISLSQVINLDNKKILILGAGGTAKAIAYELSKLMVELMVASRRIEQAEEIVMMFGGSAYHLAQLPKLANQIAYDVIIHTIPQSAYTANTPFASESIIPNSVAMDINYQIGDETSFLQIAKARGSNCISGYNMYLYQAMMQLSNWFNIPLDVLKHLN